MRRPGQANERIPIVGERRSIAPWQRLRAGADALATPPIRAGADLVLQARMGLRALKQVDTVVMRRQMQYPRHE